MEAISTDVRDDRRWQLEAKHYGEVEANCRALRRIFQNEHYRGMRNEHERREKWDKLISEADINDLVINARDLFELIENETRGVIRFVPGMRVWDEGIYRYVDSSGKGKKGLPLFWHAQGYEGLNAQLHYSSDVETKIYERLGDKRSKISKEIEVFGKSLCPEILNDVFGKYHRDFSCKHNYMPMTVESAFNHIPALKRSLKVKGFPYPHKVSNIVFGVKRRDLIYAR
jgi:hypothetical protein